MGWDHLVASDGITRSPVWDHLPRSASSGVVDARLAVAVVDETIRAERVRLFDVEVLHRLIRDVPKPVIAAVNGAVIAGGSRPPRLCDITIAAETATFGQRNPRRRSFDAGSGSAYLARILGEKRAREVWYLSVGTTQRL